MKKRLFIFAGYDKDSIVDATLLWYLNALSKLGDIVFVMDTDLPKSELAKITKIPNVLYANATRHGEYDFGSYKRGYIWARDKKLLDKYEWVYLVNDSVVGPIGDLSICILDMESHDADMIGMIGCNNNDVLPHIQSWFVGLRRHVANAPFFNEFMLSVKHMESKDMIIFSYEIRMTQIVLQHGYKYYTYSTAASDLYTNPTKCIAHGILFIKKLALPKILGTYNMYSCIDENMRNEILNYATRAGLTPNKVAEITNYPYEKTFRLTLFSFPIISMYTRRP